MTYKTYTGKLETKTHGGYRNLKSYQGATIIYDLTVQFCNCYIDKRSRTHDQMVQAARSGQQNIAEGSQASATSKKSELKLLGVARASLEELLNDYQNYLRQHGLTPWDKDSNEARGVRTLAYTTNRSYETYMSYAKDPQSFANCIICLTHQANYLLDHQLDSLEKTFIEQGGYTENLFKKRLDNRRRI